MDKPTKAKVRVLIEVSDSDSVLADKVATTELTESVLLPDGDHGAGDVDAMNGAVKRLTTEAVDKTVPQVVAHEELTRHREAAKTAA